MAIDKGGAQREGQQQNEGDGGQPTVIDWLTVAVFGNGLSAMSAGVQKAMLKRPMLSEIVPAVVLQNPTIMAEPAVDPGVLLMYSSLSGRAFYASTIRKGERGRRSCRPRDTTSVGSMARRKNQARAAQPGRKTGLHCANAEDG